MLFRSLVPSSKFNDVLDELNPSELKLVARQYDKMSDSQVVNVNATVSPDRLAQFVSLTDATVHPDPYLPKFDRLYIDGQTEIGEYSWDNHIGSIGIWTSGPDEKVV